MYIYFISDFYVSKHDFPISEFTKVFNSTNIFSSKFEATNLTKKKKKN